MTCPNRAAHNNERRSLESLCSRFHKGYSKKSPYDFLWLHALALEGISGYFVSGVGLSTLVLEPGLQRREAVFVWSQREATRKQTILGLTREAPRKPNQFGGILNHLLECLTSLKIKHKPAIRFSEGQGGITYMNHCSWFPFRESQPVHSHLPRLIPLRTKSGAGYSKVLAQKDPLASGLSGARPDSLHFKGPDSRIVQSPYTQGIKQSFGNDPFREPLEGTPK